MAWELFYTSAPRGLRPGSRGFCTVARSEGMPQALIDRVESLSGYPPASLQTQSAATSLPPVVSHYRISILGKSRSVLSRIAMGGSDYSGRMNKFAYHLVLDSAEQAPAGPIWMAWRSGKMKETWTGDPAVLPPIKFNFDEPCETLSDASVDNRNARLLADAFMSDASKSACIVYDWGVDPLPLLAEAMSLLEPRMRWQVTFNTCFTELSAGLSCHWRCVPSNSPTAGEAHRHATSGVLIQLRAAVDAGAPPATSASLTPDS